MCGRGQDRRAHCDGPRDRADEGQRHERLIEDVAALDVVHGHDDVVGDPHRIEAERFRLLGDVGNQSRRGILPPMRETDAELHVEMRSVSHGGHGLRDLSLAGRGVEFRDRGAKDDVIVHGAGRSWSGPTR